MSSENLFFLIKSLKQSEKRYFKVFASQHSSVKKSNPVKLFNAIDRQNEYDENKIIKKFSKEPFVNYLSKGKNYLYNLILKSLRNYHSHSSINSQLKDILREAEILFEKALFKQSKKLLSKAKKLAYSYEKDSHLLEIFKWEKKIFYSLGKLEYFEKTLKEEQQILDKRKNIYEFDKLLSLVFKITKGEGLLRDKNKIKKLDEIIKHPLLSNEKKNVETRRASSLHSFDAKLRYYNIYSLYYQATGNQQNSSEVCKKWVELLESQPGRINESPFKYVTALDNYLLCLNRIKNSNEFLSSLNKLKTIPQIFSNAKTQRVEGVIFVRYYNHLLSFYNHIGNFEKAIEQIPEIEAGLKKFEGKTDKKQTLALYLYIANAYFSLNNYSDASKWLNKILNAQMDIREDVQGFARILKLIISYEQSNIDEIEKNYRITYRILIKRKQMYKFESVVWEFFKTKLLNGFSRKELIKAFKDLRDKLNEIMKDPFERKALEYFDFMSWLQSKVEDKSFLVIIKSKLRID